MVIGIEYEIPIGTAESHTQVMSVGSLTGEMRAPFLICDVLFFLWLAGLDSKLRFKCSLLSLTASTQNYQPLAGGVRDGCSSRSVQYSSVCILTVSRISTHVLFLLADVGCRRGRRGNVGEKLLDELDSDQGSPGCRLPVMRVGTRDSFRNRGPLQRGNTRRT